MSLSPKNGRQYLSRRDGGESLFIFSWHPSSVEDERSFSSLMIWVINDGNLFLGGLFVICTQSIFQVFVSMIIYMILSLFLLLVLVVLFEEKKTIKTEFLTGTNNTNNMGYKFRTRIATHMLKIASEYGSEPMDMIANHENDPDFTVNDSRIDDLLSVFSFSCRSSFSLFFSKLHPSKQLMIRLISMNLEGGTFKRDFFGKKPRISLENRYYTP